MSIPSQRLLRTQCQLGFNPVTVLAESVHRCAADPGKSETIASELISRGIAADLSDTCISGQAGRLDTGVESSRRCGSCRGQPSCQTRPRGRARRVALVVQSRPRVSPVRTACSPARWGYRPAPPDVAQCHHAHRRVQHRPSTMVLTGDSPRRQDATVCGRRDRLMPRASIAAHRTRDCPASPWEGGERESPGQRMIQKRVSGGQAGSSVDHASPPDRGGGLVHRGAERGPISWRPGPVGVAAGAADEGLAARAVPCLQSEADSVRMRPT